MPNYGSMAGIRGYKTVYIYDKRLPYSKDDLVAWVDNTKRTVTVRRALVDIKAKASFKNANWTEMTFSGLDTFSESRAYKTGDIAYWVEGDILSVRRANTEVSPGTYNPSQWNDFMFKPDAGGNGAELGYSQDKSYKTGDMLFETSSANRLVFYSAKKDIPKNTPFNVDDWLKYDLEGAEESNNLNGMIYDTSKSYQKGDVVLYEKRPNVFEILRAKKNIGIGEAFNHRDWESGTVADVDRDNPPLTNVLTGGEATAFYMNHAFIEYGCNVFGSPSERKLGLNHDGTSGVTNSALRFGSEVITIPDHVISYPIPTNSTNEPKVWDVQAGKKYTGDSTLLNNSSNEYLKVTEIQDTSMCLLCTVTVPPNDDSNDLTRCTIARGPARASTATPNIVIPTNNKIRIPYHSSDLKYLVQFFDRFGNPAHFVRIVSRDNDGFDVEGTECVYGKKITWCVLRPDKYVEGGWFSLVASNSPSVVISGFSPEKSKNIQDMVITDSVINTSSDFALLERQAMYSVPKFISISRLRKITQSMFGREPGVDSETIGGVVLKRIDNGHYAVVETGESGKKIIHLGYFTIRENHTLDIGNEQIVGVHINAGYESILVSRSHKPNEHLYDLRALYVTFVDNEALRTMMTFGLVNDGTAPSTSDQWFRFALYPDFEGHEAYVCTQYPGLFYGGLGSCTEKFCGTDLKANDDCVAGIAKSILEYAPKTDTKTTVQMNSAKSGIIVPYFNKFLEEYNWDPRTTELHIYSRGKSFAVCDTEPEHVCISAGDYRKFTAPGRIYELCIEASTLPYTG